MSVVWFCQCSAIPAGGFCYKHGKVNEVDRLRRKHDTEAFKRLSDLAQREGWSNIEKRLAVALVQATCMAVGRWNPCGWRGTVPDLSAPCPQCGAKGKLAPLVKVPKPGGGE